MDFRECFRIKGKKCSVKGKLQIPPACVDRLEEWNALLKRKGCSKMEISNFKIECSEENGRREGIQVSKKQNRKIFCQAISKEVYIFKMKNNWSEDELI